MGRLVRQLRTAPTPYSLQKESEVNQEQRERDHRAELIRIILNAHWMLTEDDVRSLPIDQLEKMAGRTGGAL